MENKMTTSSFQPITRSVGNYWQLFITEGLLMCALGLAALLLPFIAALGMAVVMGILLVATGLFGFVSGLFAPDAPGVRWSLFSSAITLVFGLIFFAWPFGGVKQLAMGLASFLAADGVLAIAMSAEHRKHFTKKWVLLLISGAVSVAGAVFLAWWVPRAEPWTLGTIIGIDFIVSGVALTIIALEARTNEKT